MGAIRHLERMLGKPPRLADLSGDVGQRLSDWLVENGRSPVTASNNRWYLRSLWDHAADRGDVERRVEQTPTFSPTEWHHRPWGHKNQKCPVCDCPAHVSGLHRAASPDESSRKWLKRKKTDDGYLEQEVGMPFIRKLVRAPTGPNEKTLRLIVRGAAMQAAGKTWKQIADAIEITPAMVGEWRRVYAGLWKTAFDNAIEQNAKLLLAMAGTEDALKLAGMFVDSASGASKAIEAKIQSVLPDRMTSDNTLTEFFRGYFKPVCLGETGALQIANYERSIRAWYLLTGDPPLKSITPATLATFRDRVTRLPNARRIGHIGSVTVNGYLRWTQAVLDKAGPPMRGQRDAAGILNRVPWIKRPLAIGKIPRVVPVETLNQFYLALVAAEMPRIDSMQPAQWWRSLIVVAVCTGLRRGSLFGLRMDDIDWAKRRLLIRPTNNKSRKTFSIHLNETCYQHLRRVCVNRNREKVFVWPHGTRWFYATFHRLQDAAGIPRAEHFGLHNLRKTLATMLYETSPGAAQIAMGHSDARTTAQHYVAPNAMVARALDALPLPEAFTAGSTGAA